MKDKLSKNYEKLKENLIEVANNRTNHDIVNGLDKINIMHPVEYIYQGKQKYYQRDCGIHLDVSELQNNIPDKYVKVEKNSIFIDNDYLTNIIIQSIKEQNKRIDDIEKKLDSLAN